MINRIFIIIIAISLFSTSVSAEKSVSTKDFGAVGDGIADDTAAIQEALDVIEGNGIVHLPAGSYKISDSLRIPHGVTLMGEGARWQNSATRIIVPENGFPAIRMSHACSVKGFAIVYPNNQNNANPEEYPPAIQLEGINPSVENIVFDCAWIGVSTAPGGVNAGQGMFKELTGFVHHIGVHISGGKCINRFQDIHWFVGGENTPGQEAYFRKNRVGFQFGGTDGVFIDRSFMIFGKAFFHQLPHRDTPDGSTPVAHSLGFAIDNCWIEHVDNGFIFEGNSGFTLSNTNILLNKGGFGVKVNANSLFYNAVISGVQVRSVGGEITGIEYDINAPHVRNRLAISDVQVTDGAPAIHLKSGAQRAQVQNSHLIAADGHPAILIDEGADVFTITNNILTGEIGIQDNSGDVAKKTISGNISDN